MILTLLSYGFTNAPVPIDSHFDLLSLPVDTTSSSFMFILNMRVFVSIYVYIFIYFVSSGKEPLDTSFWSYKIPQCQHNPPAFNIFQTLLENIHICNVFFFFSITVSAVLPNISWAHTLFAILSKWLTSLPQTIATDTCSSASNSF